ncbi:hypothetical protein DSO57_1015781 [Entomophthora muscae]|uniref:Uncharacterized protein n=1 Tax=Entomophthora muscae TaxID=34485 RepID=A0ACC2T577_9FUNG|nr:hypothetical protein DSO57_1015781 [Entomophthora muscae]
MAMRGATNHQKATTLITTLDATRVNLVMPHLPATNWTYQEARKAVLEEFGGEDILFTRKSEFGAIKFSPGKNLQEFAEQFYHDALVLLSSGTVSTFDIRAAMKQATHPYKELHRAMTPAYTKGKVMLEIVDCLQSHAKTFGPPNRPESKQPKPDNVSCSEARHRYTTGNPNLRIGFILSLS